MKRYKSSPAPCGGSLLANDGHAPSPDGKTGVCGACGSTVAFTINVASKPVPRVHRAEGTRAGGQGRR